jgi:hypothetical protein
MYHIDPVFWAKEQNFSMKLLPEGCFHTNFLSKELSSLFSGMLDR